MIVDIHRCIHGRGAIYAGTAGIDRQSVRTTDAQPADVSQAAGKDELRILVALPAEYQDPFQVLVRIRLFPHLYFSSIL